MTTTWQIESIALRELKALDLREEAAQLQFQHSERTPLTRDDIEDALDTSTEEPFRQFPALAFRLRVPGMPFVDVLVATQASRVGIAAGADAQWGDLRDPCDLTTVDGGDSFRAALHAAIRDWLDDPDAWEARA
jgi:hypothetical protein